MTDTTTAPAPAQAAKDGKGKGKGKRKERQTPVEVGFVDAVPPRTRNDYWMEQIDELRENPGRNKLYTSDSSTTASYLKARYGVNTTTRSRADGKFDLYVHYPAKEVDGVTVADEAKVNDNLERYGKSDEDE